MSFILNKYSRPLIISVVFLSSLIVTGTISHYKAPNDSIVEPGISGADYVLPYPVGEKYQCSQSFGGNISHQGVFYYSVDFFMPKESVITAARKGEVTHIINNFSNQDIGTDKSNVVIIQHEDGTYARYGHLTHNGALVRVGQQVNPGDKIGLSGKSGAITYHLHFDVTKDCPQSNCQTIPFKFKNCYINRIKLVGRPTRGVVSSPSKTMILPGNAKVQLVASGLSDKTGKYVVEWVGVQPDVLIPYSIEDIRSSIDRDLIKAIDILKKKSF